MPRGRFVPIAYIGSIIGHDTEVRDIYGARRPSTQRWITSLTARVFRWQFFPRQIGKKGISRKWTELNNHLTAHSRAAAPFLAYLQTEPPCVRKGVRGWFKPPHLVSRLATQACKAEVQQIQLVTIET